jgi:hypothetical protein
MAARSMVSANEPKTTVTRVEDTPNERHRITRIISRGDLEGSDYDGIFEVEELKPLRSIPGGG